MSNKKNEEKLSSVTTTTEGVADETETSLEGLSPTEEKVVRMLHGLSEDDSRNLEFGLGASDDSRLKLAMIERQLVDQMSGSSAGERDDDRPSPAELLSSWLDEE